MTFYSIRVREKDRQRVATLKESSTNPSTHGLRLSRVNAGLSLCHRSRKPSRRWVFLLDYTALGNESNSDASGKCYWWLWSETAHKGVAKLVPLTERLAGVVAPKGMTEGALG